MRIELGQDEIEQLIHEHLAEMGVNVEGKDVAINLAVRRVPTQTIVAEIDINRPRPEAEVGQEDTPAPKARAPRQPRKTTLTPVELVTGPMSDLMSGAASPPWEETEELDDDEDTNEVLTAVAQYQAEQSTAGLFAVATPTAPEAAPVAGDKVSLFV